MRSNSDSLSFEGGAGLTKGASSQTEMVRVEKTVFVSYRRANAPWALAIFQDLTHNGYDVFFDFTGIASGDFESVILTNIQTRAHFLVLLTPSALERCKDPRDWLRREVEVAINSRRNIVPIMLEGFDFGSPHIAEQLSGPLADLGRYNGLRVPAEYFLEAMERLRKSYLAVALDAVSHPISAAAKQATAEQQAAASAAPMVEKGELTAQEWFERGFSSTTAEERIGCFSNAIRLKPEFPYAFVQRGLALREKDDLNGAIEDFDHALRLNPNFVPALVFRGLARRDQGNLDGALRDYDLLARLAPDNAFAFRVRGQMRFSANDIPGAIADYTQSIHLNKDDGECFYSRGYANYSKGDLDEAIRDYTEAIHLVPGDADYFFMRAVVYQTKGDPPNAIRDYTEAIRLKPDHSHAFHLRALERQAQGDLDGAIEDYTEAIRLSPHPTESHRLRALALQAKGDIDGALRDREEIKRLTDGDLDSERDPRGSS